VRSRDLVIVLELNVWVRVVVCSLISVHSTSRSLDMSNNNRAYVQPGEPLNEFLRSFWQRQVDAAEQETPDYRHPPLPLARIKKVMKSDPDVKVRLPEESHTSHYLKRWPEDDCSRRYELWLLPVFGTGFETGLIQPRFCSVKLAKVRPG